MDATIAGLVGASVAAAVTFFGTVRGGRSDEIRALWAENRARGADVRQEREDRQQLERNLRAEMGAALEASEARCRAELADMQRRCDAERQALELRIAALGGA
jgi:hypothetical protein